MLDVDINEILSHINPASLSYSDWTMVGMALKHEGYSSYVWDDWSRADRRYKSGECERKWNTFNEATSQIVTGGTLIEMARQGGWTPSAGRAFGWDDVIEYEEGVVVQKGWAEDCAIEAPDDDWHPGKEVIRYLETLFEPGETIGYVVESTHDSERDKYIPHGRGVYNLTAGEIIEKVRKAKDDIGAAIGDYNPLAGAWIRFNPLDGQGVRNTNVSEFRYALVESDSLEIEKQNSIIREMELPVAVLMYSGGKSLHAIVRVDAMDFKEYQQRVEYLYSICAKNGLEVDTQNKNPSRLSRLPGCIRGDQKQYIIDTNIGKKTWNEWHEWIESINDNLPDVEDLSNVWEDLPPLAETLIDGILRIGHKMLIAGPSKAGKSFSLIELSIAIAEGRKWMGHQCKQGRVMYVNLELDRASCLHRFKDVYTYLAINPTRESLANVDIWNLRGKSVPMDKLAPKLIRRAKDRHYTAIIIDPIYKVITGDENSAEQMAKFCNQFDKIATELKCSVIYCHHHSKGAQGGKKSMDRASGSGVFARDPDAQVDMIELPITREAREVLTEREVCNVIEQFMTAHFAYDDNEPSEDDKLKPGVLENYAQNTLDQWQWNTLRNQIDDIREKMVTRTGWRLEYTLREFASPAPQNIWFDYPVHMLDDSGMLQDIDPDDDEDNLFKRAAKKRREDADELRKKQMDSFEIAFSNLELDGKDAITAKDLSEIIGVTQNTMCLWFGNGSRQRTELKDKFEKYQPEKGGQVYFRRKQEQVDET